MKRLLTIGTVFLAAGIVLFAAYRYTQAQGTGYTGLTLPPEPAIPSVLPPDPKTPPLYLGASYITEAYPFICLNSEDYYCTPLECSPTRFTCTGPCTLEITQNVSAGLSSVAGNELFLAYLLDGCWSGWWPATPLESDGAPTQTTVSLSVCLCAGTHCVWSFAHSVCGDEAVVGYYHNSYRVYTTTSNLSPP